MAANPSLVIASRNKDKYSNKPHKPNVELQCNYYGPQNNPTKLIHHTIKPP